MITIDDFKKLEIAVAKILEVNDHPNADRLYVVKVDLGDETRQVVAGIKAFYPKEELIGKYAVILKNLEPAMLRGIESNGMLLASKDGDNLSILTIEKPLKLGSPVS